MTDQPTQLTLTDQPTQPAQPDQLTQPAQLTLLDYTPDPDEEVLCTECGVLSASVFSVDSTLCHLCHKPATDYTPDPNAAQKCISALRRIGQTRAAPDQETSNKGTSSVVTASAREPFLEEPVCVVRKHPVYPEPFYVHTATHTFPTPTSVP